MLNAIKYACFACFFFFLTKTGNAQSCTGTLGAPVLNVDFGNAANPPKRLPIYPSGNYYLAGACPPGGSYTFDSITAHCFNDTWITLTEDHTPGDIGGYMMQINPDSVNLYIDTLHLCGGTTYEFSAWLINLDSANACGGGPGQTRPNVTFTIETPTGIVLDSLDTGDIQPTTFPATWNQYTFFFTLPDTYYDVVVRIKNNLFHVPCGNDFAMDDITIRPCGLSIGAAFAQPGAIPDTLHFCEADNRAVSINGNWQSGFQQTTFQWQASSDSGKTWTDITGANDSSKFTKTFTAAGTFQYRMTASAGASNASIGCRTLSNTLNVLVDKVPAPQPANTSPVCAGSPIAFSANTGDYNYQWSGPAGFTSAISSPAIAVTVPGNSGEYYLLTTTVGGCRKQDSTSVIVSDFPAANAGRDTAICTGNSVNLQATGGSQYSWQPAGALSNPNSSNPLASPIATTSYIVKVSNQYNCMANDTMLVTVNPNPIAGAGQDVSICKGQTSVNLQGSGGSQYLWSPATGLSDPSIAHPAATPSVTTRYILKVTNQFNCSASDSVLITVFTKPTANAGPDKTISIGQSIILNGTASGDTSYFWTPAQFISDARMLAPTVSPAYDITYTLHVGPENACGTATDDVVVHVTTNLIIPNAFSPNGDGINDTWNIGGLILFAGAEVKVFNRFGQVVFYSKDYNKPWDGRLNGNPLPTGTYYYTLDRKKNLPLISGWVEIVR